LSDENEIFYSQASFREISIKYIMGKLVLIGMSPEDFYQEIKNSYLKCNSSDNEELITSYELPIEHKDPFDRIMICNRLNQIILSCYPIARLKIIKNMT